MKNLNKKGFTIIELVIVIAVIAILAAVLIPTFNSVISKANESAAMQEANAALKIVESHYTDMTTKRYFFYVFKNASDAAAVIKGDGSLDSEKFSAASYVYVYDSESKVAEDGSTVVFYNAEANLQVDGKDAEGKAIKVDNDVAKLCINTANKNARQMVSDSTTLDLTDAEKKDLGDKVVVLVADRPTPTT